MNTGNKRHGTPPVGGLSDERDAEIHESKKPGTRKNNLRDLRVGDTAQIVDFFDHDETAKKIEAMGLRKGKRVTILKKLGRGILVKTGGTRIVITIDVAKNIEVK